MTSQEYFFTQNNSFDNNLLAWAFFVWSISTTRFFNGGNYLILSMLSKSQIWPWERKCSS